MRLLFCLILILLAPDAMAQPAECRVDLAAGHFDWTTPDGDQLERIRIRDAERRFTELDSLLASGDEADALRALLGAEILQPVWTRIQGADEWLIIPTEVRAVPGVLAGFTVLALPDGLREAAFERRRVILSWPEPLRAPVPRVTETRGSVLLSAPFTTDVDPATDDPDTLRRALQGALRTVQLIPRNETDVSTLRRALEESRPSVWWFRGEKTAIAGMQPAFGALPNLVIWTLPSRTTLGSPDLSPMTLSSGGEGPACIIVSARAIPETKLAPIARRLADGIARGLDCSTALHEAQREALADGIAIASSLVLIGDPRVTADPDRASWFKRLFN